MISFDNVKLIVSVSCPKPCLLDKRIGRICNYVIQENTVPLGQFTLHATREFLDGDP
jgi:hypothetical protein